MTETQVGELLERATADLRPTTDLVAGGVAAGRRQRRRGLALSAAGTLAAVALLGGAVTLAPGGGSDGDGSLVADGSGAPDGSGPNAAPSYGGLPPLGTRSANDDGDDPTYPNSLPALDGPFPVLPDAMAATLRTLLHGTVTNPADDHSPHVGLPDGWQNGAVDLDGASVTVAYQHSSGPRCDGDEGLSSCTPLGDGFLGRYTTKLYHKGDGYTGAHGVGVTFYTPDGYKVSITATNAGSADPTTPVMEQPVLDDAALTAIVQSPVWRGETP